MADQNTCIHQKVQTKVKEYSQQEKKTQSPKGDSRQNPIKWRAHVFRHYPWHRHHCAPPSGLRKGNPTNIHSRSTATLSRNDSTHDAMLWNGFSFNSGHVTSLTNPLYTCINSFDKKSRVLSKPFPISRPEHSDRNCIGLRGACKQPQKDIVSRQVVVAEENRWLSPLFCRWLEISFDVDVTDVIIPSSCRCLGSEKINKSSGRFLAAM